MKFSKYSLKNGGDIVHVPYPESGLVRVTAVFRSGFFSETAEDAGFIHVMEHLLACWTSTKHPNTQTNRERMALLGVESNAFTSSHTVGFYMQGLAEHQDEIVDYFINTFLHPKIEYNLLEREKNVVRQEYEKNISEVWHAIRTEINKFMYKGTSLAFSDEILKTNLSRCTPETLERARKKYLNLHRMVLFVTGGDVRPVIAAMNGEGESMVVAHPLGELPSPVYKNCVYVHHDAGDAYRVDIVYRIPMDMFDNRKYTLNAMNNMLTSGLTSRVYRALRDELGAVYDVNGYTNLDARSPMLSNYTISCETTEERVIEVIITILHVMNSTVFEQYEQDGFNTCIKTYIKERNLSNTLCSREEQVYEYLLWGKPFVDREEEDRRMISVKLEDAQKMLAFINSCPRTVFVSGRKNVLT
jgi:predicted Zn-dependent peptidase